MKYKGSCHCGSVKFAFNAPEIEKGLRCNCSICRRKGAIMTAFTIAPKEIQIQAEEDVIGSYEFGSGVAKHFFCRNCGIYTFHQTLRKPGHYRVNIGCLEEVDSLELPCDVFDGAAL